VRQAFLAVAVVLTAAAALPAQAAPRTVTITLDRLKFGTVPADLHQGDTIVWVNRDIFRHTATARDRSFDVDLPPGKSGKTVLKRAGTISFYCKYHPGMTGTLGVAR
jgi:plastocyanin